MPNLNLNLPDSFGVNVEENGSNSAFDSTLNFTGAGVTVTQNGSGTGTITIPGGSGTPTNSFVFHEFLVQEPSLLPRPQWTV